MKTASFSIYIFYWEPFLSEGYLQNFTDIPKMFGILFTGENCVSKPITELTTHYLEDVLLARADLDEAVLAVGADVGPLAGVDHAVVVERLPLLELLLAEVTLDRLLAVCQHVQLEAGLVLVVG